MTRRLAMLIATTAAASVLGATPAHGRASHRTWCDMFRVAYAENTSCATEQRVQQAYGRRCVPRGYQFDQDLPPCHKILLGFHCKPTGDIYAVVNCVYGQRRVGLHLAE
jgi:hypothetical protein